MGSRQANQPQATAAFGGATGAANQNMALSNQYNQQQTSLYNTLFGKGTGGGGTLSGMMNPANLNVSEPTGPFRLQYNKDVEGISNSFRNARGNLSRDLASRGFGADSPAYFGASEARGLAQGEAEAKGGAFTDYTSRAYEDALRNFWGATGMAENVLGGARTGALAGAGTAGSIYGNLYGTAGQPTPNPWMQFLQSSMSAAGQAATGNLGK